MTLFFGFPNLPPTLPVILAYSVPLIRMDAYQARVFLVNLVSQ